MSFLTEPLSAGNICNSVKNCFLPKFLITICPHCKEIYRLPYKYDDKFIECPNCQQSFWVERYFIPPKFDGVTITDYKRQISDLLKHLHYNKKTIKITSPEGCLSLSAKNHKYLLSFNDILYSAEKDIPNWKLKKILTYFCTGERDWQNLIKWSFCKDLWSRWEQEPAEQKALRQRRSIIPINWNLEDIIPIRRLTDEEIAYIVIVSILVIFLISACISGIKNPSSYQSQSTSNYNQNNNVKHPYMTEEGKKFFEGWLETAVKEETGLDSKATMKYDESSGKIYFDLKYKE